jgi:glycosidase
MIPRTPALLLSTLLVLGQSLLTAQVPQYAAEPVKTSGHLSSLPAPEWIRHETIYEINVRQYSKEGTFAGVEADLPRIRKLGVGVLWFMPIHPIGETNRKGPLGSPYAVKDYSKVNPEFGTEADFARLVKAAHAQGFRVIMDWVGNHTAWDNPLVAKHPEFYVRDAKGKFTPPTGFDWTDVIQLEFKNRAMWEYQIGVLTNWVTQFGVDGFRCDFATGVPTAFWNEMSARLRVVKPDIFLLAEGEVPQHQVRGFHSCYTFSLMVIYNEIAAGKAPVSKIDDELARSAVLFPAGATRIQYITNHDENSWQGTEFERLKGGVESFAVLTYMLDGIPLLYNGQEAGMDKRLAFFERDPIVWKPHALAGFYRTLCELKRSHPALRTGSPMRRLPTTVNESVYAVLREVPGQRLVSFSNLTAKEAKVEATDPVLNGRWRDVFTGEIVELKTPVSFVLPAWKYRVLTAEQ